MKKETHLHPMVLENAMPYPIQVHCSNEVMENHLSFQILWLRAGRTGVVDNSLNVQYPSLKE